MSRVSGAVELIRLMILRGEVGLGGRLVEVHLAERLKVGRSTLREALRRLEGEGLLVADESGGMRVLDLDRRELAEALHVRAALEALAAGLAAARVRDGRAAPAMLARLEALADAADARSHGHEPEAAVLADRHFHRAIAALGGNRPCREALEHVWDRIVLAAAHGVAAPRPPGAEHREQLAAILAGDVDEAAGLARRHVLAAAG